MNYFMEPESCTPDDCWCSHYDNPYDNYFHSHYLNPAQRYFFWIQEWKNQFDGGTGVQPTKNTECNLNTFGQISIAGRANKIIVITIYGTGNNDCLSIDVSTEF